MVRTAAEVIAEFRKKIGALPVGQCKYLCSELCYLASDTANQATPESGFGGGEWKKEWRI